MGALQNIEKARRSLKVAEAMLSRAYPIAKDTKLFLAISEGIFFALMESVEAVFALEGAVPPDVHDDVIDAFGVIAARHGFSQEDLVFLRDVRSVVRAHEESPVEFARKDGFVICDESYSFTKLTSESMQKYLFGARSFVERAASAVDARVKA